MQSKRTSNLLQIFPFTTPYLVNKHLANQEIIDLESE